MVPPCFQSQVYFCFVSKNWKGRRRRVKERRTPSSRSLGCQQSLLCQDVSQSAIHFAHRMQILHSLEFGFFFCWSGTEWFHSYLTWYTHLELLPHFNVVIHSNMKWPFHHPVIPFGILDSKQAPGQSLEPKMWGDGLQIRKANMSQRELIPQRVAYGSLCKPERNFESHLSFRLQGYPNFTRAHLFYTI